MESSEFSQEEESEDMGTPETPTGAPEPGTEGEAAAETPEIDEQPAGATEDTDLESEGAEPSDSPETSGESI